MNTTGRITSRRLGLLIIMASSVLAASLSGCASLVLKDTDSTGKKIGKASIRTLLAITTVSFSESLGMTPYRQAYKYSRSWEKAIEAGATSDDVLTRYGPPAKRESMPSGGEVWVYNDDWGSTGSAVASGYIITSSAQAHGRRTILTFNNERKLVFFSWNSW